LAVNVHNLGFGSYSETLNADIIEVMTYFYLKTKNTVTDKINEFLNG